MIKPPSNIRELPLADRGLLALKAAVERVFEEHAREGLPIYIWRGGKVVAVSAKELAKGRNGKRKQRWVPAPQSR